MLRTSIDQIRRRINISSDLMGINLHRGCVFQTSLEMPHLAPNAQVSLFPWKDTKENVTLAVRHLRTFLRANRPAGY